MEKEVQQWSEEIEDIEFCSMLPSLKTVSGEKKGDLYLRLRYAKVLEGKLEHTMMRLKAHLGFLCMLAIRQKRVDMMLWALEMNDCNPYLKHIGLAYNPNK